MSSIQKIFFAMLFLAIIDLLIRIIPKIISLMGA